MLGLCLFEISTWTLVRRLQSVDKEGLAVVFSPDNRHVLGCNGSGMYFWDVESGRAVHSVAGLAHEFVCVAISHDGARALSGTGHSRGMSGDVAYTVRLWDLESMAELGRFSGHNGDVVSVAFSPDSRLAASGGDQTVRVWKLP
jgi:WD40 repeat protein